MTNPAAGSQDDELRELLATLRDNVLTNEQAHRLEVLLQSDDALKEYIRSVAMQADLCGYFVGWSVSKPTAGLDDEGGIRLASEGAILTPTVSAQALPVFQQTLYGQAVFEDPQWPQADDEEPTLLPPWSPRMPADRNAIEANRRRWRLAGLLSVAAAAAVVLLSMWRWPATPWNGRPPSPVAIKTPSIALTTAPAAMPAAELIPPAVVATITASLDAVWRGLVSPVGVGAPLRVGMSIELTSGFARLTFTNGVEVVIEAPTQFTLESENSMLLTSGRLSAIVPERARGFSVNTKLLNVVDIGTEFGVNVAADGTVDVPVFTGRIEARTSSGKDAAPINVEAGKAGRANASGFDVKPSGPEVAQYVRDIKHIRGPFHAKSTGQALKIGDPDPSWIIRSVGYEPNWKPTSAIVCGPGPKSLTNDARSAWVSTTGARNPVPSGQYTFETTFDLSRFDPTTAELQLRLGVDDYIREVRLNGHPTPIMFTYRGNNAKSRLHDFTLNEGFVPGINRLEVVVQNSTGSGIEKIHTAMALRVELSGTGVRKLDGQ